MLSPQHLTEASESRTQVCRSPATICLTVIGSQAQAFVVVVVWPFGHGAHWRSVVAVPSLVTWVPTAQFVHGLQGLALSDPSLKVFGPQVLPSGLPPSGAPAVPLAPLS